MFQLHLGADEYARRLKRMREYMEANELDGLCVFGAMRTFYLCGFHHLPTERPVVLVVPLQGEIALMVPYLEEENIPVRTPHIREVKVYREYPGVRHPMQYLRELLDEKGLADKHLGVDTGGWGGGWGYRGQTLQELVPNATLSNVANVIDDMRMVKSPEELRLLGVSAQMANLAHGILHEHIQIGKTEIETSLEASAAATAAMANVMGPEWEGRGAHIEFTSGPKTAHNHRSAGGRRVVPGDVLLTGTGPSVGGYLIELERMMIVGTPTERHRKYFELEVEAQDVALAAVRPGARCSDVEKAVNGFLEKKDLMDLARTHIGHGIGIEGHEGPFLDVGDDTVIEPGMVLCVEPCLFIPGFAGFRHSDTVVVTEDGIEMLTTYPRDIESLTVHL